VNHRLEALVESEWLTSVGFEKIENTQNDFKICVDDGYEGFFEIRLVDSEHGFFDVNVHTYAADMSHEEGVGLTLVKIVTRGEVLNLCCALGVIYE